jgi:soluble lytic murein transglycosylase-like protein
MSPLSAGVGLLAWLTASVALPDAAHAQIFGDVRPDGAVVLTNIRGGTRDARLRVIVEDRSAAAVVASTAPQPPSGDAVDTSQFGAIIAEAGRRWNVRPELLRAMIAVESRFDPLAVSRRGARGLMQLMPETAKRFTVGDLFDPRTNVLAGAQYLRLLLDLFHNDVELALAAYNAGEQSVIKAGYRIPAIPETQSYVPAVLARYRRLVGG